MTFVAMDLETTRNLGLEKGPGLMLRMKAYVAGTRAVRQLNRLDDRLLADIGINRGEIKARALNGR